MLLNKDIKPEFFIRMPVLKTNRMPRKKKKIFKKFGLYGWWALNRRNKKSVSWVRRRIKIDKTGFNTDYPRTFSVEFKER